MNIILKRSIVVKLSLLMKITIKGRLKTMKFENIEAIFSACDLNNNIFNIVSYVFIVCF